MCGITGFLALNGARIDRALLERMTHTLAHRGPDNRTIYVQNPVGFGFTRLSIIDLANGNQPFVSPDGSVALICNGEIYNYKELRQELIKKGYVFKTNCDIEVILNLYEHYGIEKTLQRLNGQFAFALWDGRERKLLLARDHFGICPLFYALEKDAFLFGSEIKAILEYPTPRKINFTALDQILSFPGMVSPQTMFAGVESLKPGHYLTVQHGACRLTEYWDFDYPAASEPDAGKSEAYYLEGLDEKLSRSIRYRLNADVPVGYYLSGGLDSSLVVAMGERVSGQSPRTFSMRYPSNADIDETYFQELLVQQVGARHVRIDYNPGLLPEHLYRSIAGAEAPLKETYNACSLSLSRAVRDNNIKVVLSGEGADELFGGYYGYRFDAFRQNVAAQKGVEDLLEEEIRRELWGDPDFLYENNLYELSQLKQDLFSDRLNGLYDQFDCYKTSPVNKHRLAGRDAFGKRSYLDFKLRLADHLISDHCDRVNYANSIEGRYPFLDVDLVEFALRIPARLKMKMGEEKYILKQLARRYVNAEIVNRKKFGWVAPASPALLKSKQSWVLDLLSDDRIRRDGFFNPKAVEALKQQYAQPDFSLNTGYQSDLLIVVLTFNIFRELFPVSW